MKQTKLTTLGYITGAVVAIGSFLRWFVYYSDLKQTLIGVGLGFMALGFAYLYQRVTELKNDDETNKEEIMEDVNGIGRGLEALKKWTVDSIEKIEKKI